MFQRSFFCCKYPTRRLDSTQLYTQVSIAKLREIHAATHPGARLTAAPNAEDLAGEAGEDEQLPLLAAEDELPK